MFICSTTQIRDVGLFDGVMRRHLEHPHRAPIPDGIQATLHQEMPPEPGDAVARPAGVMVQIAGPVAPGKAVILADAKGIISASAVLTGAAVKGHAPGGV